MSPSSLIWWPWFGRRKADAGAVTGTAALVGSGALAADGVVEGQGVPLPHPSTFGRGTRRLPRIVVGEAHLYGFGWLRATAVPKLTNIEREKELVLLLL